MPSISTEANAIVAVSRATKRSRVFFMVIVVLRVSIFFGVFNLVVDWMQCKGSDLF